MNSSRIFVLGLVLVVLSVIVMGRATRQDDVEHGIAYNHAGAGGILLSDPTIESDTAEYSEFVVIVRAPSDTKMSEFAEKAEIVQLIDLVPDDHRTVLISRCGGEICSHSIFH